MYFCLTPALIRVVPQPIGTATLVSNLGGLQRFATIQPQPQLIQIDGSADQVPIKLPHYSLRNSR